MARPTDYGLDLPDDPQESLRDAGCALHHDAYNLTRYFARVGHAPNWDEVDALLRRLTFSMNTFGVWLNDDDYDDPIDAGVPVAAQQAEYEALVSSDEEASNGTF